MSSLVVNQNVKHASIEAVVIRADGRIENLGVVAYYHKNPWKRFVWRVSEIFKGRFKW